MNLIMEKDEVVIKEGKANNFNLFLSKGGKLTLTNRRVFWQGHVAGQVHAIRLEDIVAYGKCFTFVILGLFIPIPNAFYISTNAGKTYKYTVFGRKTWLLTLTQSIQDARKKKNI